jgi:hypothetical protein
VVLRGKPFVWFAPGLSQKRARMAGTHTDMHTHTHTHTQTHTHRHAHTHAHAHTQTHTHAHTHIHTHTHTHSLSLSLSLCDVYAGTWSGLTGWHCPATWPSTTPRCWSSVSSSSGATRMPRSTAASSPSASNTCVRVIEWMAGWGGQFSGQWLRDDKTRLAGTPVCLRGMASLHFLAHARDGISSFPRTWRSPLAHAQSRAGRHLHGCQ